jgi:THO complex subunit 4
VTGNGGRTTGAVRRGPLMVNTRPSSYAIAKASSKNVDAYICS